MLETGYLQNTHLHDADEPFHSKQVDRVFKALILLLTGK
jgi:hypothetical protein